jgi:putative NADH-flavin reductase
MRLLVFGATGATGQQIVMQGLQQGHELTIFVRDPAKLTLREDGLRVVVGSAPENADAICGAVRGQDAVISALGVRNSLKSGNLISRSMQAIIPAMEREAVRRLILTSAFGVGDTRRDAPLLPRIMYRVLLDDIFADKAAGEQYLRKSSLDWTLVYPVLLTNGPRTGQYRAGERLRLRGLPMISRADVADFILKQLQDTTYLRKGVAISY